MVHFNAADGHMLPEALTAPSAPEADAAAPPRREPRRRRKGLWAALAAAAIVGTAGGGTQLWANLSYDIAADEFSAASAAMGSAQREVHRSAERAGETLDAAARIVTDDAALLTTEESRVALDAALATARTTWESASDAAAAPAPVAPEKPFWAWELLGELDDLSDDSDAAQEHAAQLDDARAELESNAELVTTSTTNLLTEATAAIPGFEQAHVSARNADIIELREARDGLAEVTQPDAATADAFARLNTAASAVVVSHEETLAAKAGRLRAQRLEVESFARSIAGGVLLDFEWRQMVNGRGLGGSAGGLATWNAAHGGYSTITLSHSVAERWPADVMKSLVAHEVGHAISAKCYEMFDWEDRDANEQWATAWALSLGHTADGNGVALYGHPTQDLIDKAAACR